MSTAITSELADKVREVVDAGLCRGMGTPTPGDMCVEAAICYAMGLPHSDKPTCVGAAVRAYKIALNDADWPSNADRAAGLREIAVAHLGSNEIDQQKFAEIVCLETIRRILPIALRGIGLEKEAAACEQVTDLKSAESAARSAESAAWSAELAAKSAAESAESAAESAAWSAAWSAELAAKSAAESAESAAWSAVWSAESATEKNLSILRLAAQIGVDALRICGAAGVQFLD